MIPLQVAHTAGEASAAMSGLIISVAAVGAAVSAALAARLSRWHAPGPLLFVSSGGRRSSARAMALPAAG
jgi:hypothetical protein